MSRQNWEMQMDLPAPRLFLEFSKKSPSVWRKRSRRSNQIFRITCYDVGITGFRQRRARAAIMELAREIAEINEALRGIAELEAESRRFRFRMRRLWLRTRRRLKLRRKRILYGGMAVSFAWSVVIVCLVATGRAQIAFLWLSLSVMLWLTWGIACLYID